VCIDAVDLLTPTYLHAEQIVAGLAAGKPVSCQKPLSYGMADFSRLPVSRTTDFAALTLPVGPARLRP
jgi:Oxidoreductase family, NAD-binding Rossmann fold